MLYDDQSVQKQKRSYLFWFLFFSLLFHATLFLLFLIFGFESSSLNRFKDFFVRHEDPTVIVFHDDKRRSDPLSEPLQQAQKESDKIENEENFKPLPPPIIQVTSAKLTAPLSSFGYPDAEKEAALDVEIPDVSDGEIENVMSAPIVQPQQEQVVAQRIESVLEPAAEEKEELLIEKVAEHHEPKVCASIVQQSAIIDEMKSTLQQDAVVHDELKKNEPTSKLADRIRLIEKKLQDQQANKALSCAQNGEQLGFRVDGPEVKVRGAQSEEKKSTQKKNILALTKGFVEKLWGEDGTDLIDRDGDPNQRPSFEELKFIGYEAKINWALQASWKQNFEHNPRKRTAPGIVNVSFVIDAQGVPQNITIVQSSGHVELDQTIVCNIKSAAPFPPIPAHLQMAEYPVRRSIQVFLYGRSF